MRAIQRPGSSIITTMAALPRLLVQAQLLQVLPQRSCMGRGEGQDAGGAGKESILR